MRDFSHLRLGAFVSIKIETQEKDGEMAKNRSCFLLFYIPFDDFHYRPKARLIIDYVVVSTWSKSNESKK